MRGQRSDVRVQRTEGRNRRSDVRGQKTEILLWERLSPI
jgi:hypothetical protein